MDIFGGMGWEGHLTSQVCRGRVVLQERVILDSENLTRLGQTKRQKGFLKQTSRLFKYLDTQDIFHVASYEICK